MNSFRFKKNTSRDNALSLSSNGLLLLLLMIGLLSSTRLGYYGDSVYLTVDFFSWQFRELLTFGMTYFFAR